MNCEVCGKKIVGFPARVSIERSVLLVCQECSKFGTKVDKATVKRFETTSPRPGPKRLTIKKPKEKFEEFILIENYGEMIRKSRERVGMSRDELAKRLGEKESVIRRIEGGEMYPDASLTERIERLLKIRLRTTVERVDTVQSPLPSGTTLGDIAVLKDGKS
ncbi:MAG: multiprotein bridging factor aMBF1 [Candidatus Verstraetearchaeota archaeon]|nr:multiprotein bridging factor aMBF1 [Candidatus Verstraetearchaeota archaeon]